MRSYKMQNLMVVSAILAAVATTQADTVRLEPTADNWISSCSSGSTVNNGTDDYLRVRSSWWGPAGAKEPKNFRSLLQFELSSLPGDSSLIAEARLGLYYFSAPHADPAGRTYDVYAVTHDWSETGATWQARENYDQASPTYWDGYSAGTPTYQPGGADIEALSVASAIVPAATDTWMTWDVSDLLAGWIDNPSSRHGLLVKDANEVAANPGGNISHHAQFRSREFSDPTLRPYLEVTYVPEPGTVLVLCVGLTGIVARRPR